MPNSRRLTFPALAAAGLFWGTTVPMSKVALGWLGPAWLTSARFALAGLVLMVVSWPRLRAACTPGVLISGAIGYGGAVLLQNIGVERTSVTHAALLIGATPVLVAVIAAALRHSVARPVAWAGFALSMLGVVIIAGRQGAGSSLGGDGLVLAAQLISAAFTVSQARLLPGRDPVAVTAVQLMAAGAAMLPVSLLTEGLPAAPARPGPLLATIGLVLAGTVLPTTLFAFGQSRVPADIAGAFVNLEPLVGAVLGTIVFGDPLGPVQLAGGLAILTGISLSSAQAIRGTGARRGSVPATPGAPAGPIAHDGADAADLVGVPVAPYAGNATIMPRATSTPGTLRPVGAALGSLPGPHKYARSAYRAHHQVLEPRRPHRPVAESRPGGSVLTRGRRRGLEPEPPAARPDRGQVDDAVRSGRAVAHRRGQADLVTDLGCRDAGGLRVHLG
jgi:O-acetylserine/cysteine efflux transporter